MLFVVDVVVSVVVVSVVVVVVVVVVDDFVIPDIHLREYKKAQESTSMRILKVFW